MGTVNGVNGVILLPDNWSGDKYDNAKDGLTWKVDIYNSYYDNPNGTNFTLHTYTAQQWSTMQDNGAVFLPAAGYRSSAEMKNVGERGDYWSSTLVDADNAYNFSFSKYSLTPKTDRSRNGGLSVRLVQAAQKAPQTKEMTPTIGHLGWDEKDQQWSITVYEYAGEDPKFVFAFAVDGAKNVLPTTMTITNSTDDNYVFSDIVNPEDFSGSIKDASLTITLDGTGYKYDNVGGMYYVNAKISGEMSDADGNKLIVKEPANFIKVFVPSDVATGIEGIQPSAISIQKVLRDGQLYLMYGDRTYTFTGQEIR